jgi:hypothetical protein
MGYLVIGLLVGALTGLGLAWAIWTWEGEIGALQARVKELPAKGAKLTKPPCRPTGGMGGGHLLKG